LMFRIFLFSIAFFMGVAGQCQDQPLIEVNNPKEILNIGRQISILEDSSRKLSFGEISSKQFENKFELSKQETPNLGSTIFPVWCRFQVRNHTDQKIILSIDNSQIESLDLFIPKNDAHKSISAYEPFDRRELLLNKSSFALDLPKDSTQTYYLRLQTVTGLQFPLTLSTLPSLVEDQRTKSIIDGFFIGLMVIMILYNLLLYLTIRDRSYILYVFYMTFMTLTNVIEKGIAFEYLCPAHPILNHYINISACITGIAAVLFSMHFLH